MQMYMLVIIYRNALLASGNDNVGLMQIKTKPICWWLTKVQF